MRAFLLMTLLALAGCDIPPPLARFLPNGEPNRLAIAEAESAEAEEDAGEVLRLALGRRRATATLIQQQGTRRMWRAPGGVIVATDGARVVGTAGLPQMVMATRFDGVDPLTDPRALLARSAEARRLVDISGARRDPASMRFGVSFDCRLRGAETEDGFILIEERCRVPGFSPVVNRFWADRETGAVGYAEQWIGPGLGALALDFEPGQ
ncbi:YjbF family lipoprotein [Sediminicoccus sp. KRV36]|uniref:YjbF family lipoprotein n=1 Tax=Sediminicoccus sp. KRV36 TaxID=3133721 RepID=UPI00200D3CC5|nr:YjbF family lipoprotein [Sediminicoccus rosea]UPY37426.1 YjbF family lipoprotein [Sediminicoccus rosea]